MQERAARKTPAREAEEPLSTLPLVRGLFMADLPEHGFFHRVPLFETKSLSEGGVRFPFLTGSRESENIRSFILNR
jgi:hypothetical protein